MLLLTATTGAYSGFLTKVLTRGALAEMPTMEVERSGERGEGDWLLLFLTEPDSDFSSSLSSFFEQQHLLQQHAAAAKQQRTTKPHPTDMPTMTASGDAPFTSTPRMLTGLSVVAPVVVVVVVVVTTA